MQKLLISFGIKKTVRETIGILATKDYFPSESNHNHRHAEEEKPSPIRNVFPQSVYNITNWPVAWPATVADFASFYRRQSNLSSVKQELLSIRNYSLIHVLWK